MSSHAQIADSSTVSNTEVDVVLASSRVTIEETRMRCMRKAVLLGFAVGLLCSVLVLTMHTWLADIEMSGFQLAFYLVSFWFLGPICCALAAVGTASLGYVYWRPSMQGVAISRKCVEVDFEEIALRRHLPEKANVTLKPEAGGEYNRNYLRYVALATKKTTAA